VVVTDDATRPRFPAVQAPGAHYENYYLKAVHPDGGLGVWVRHTVHKAPGQPPVGSLWCTLFDAKRGGPLAVRSTLDPTALTVTGEGHLRVGDALFAPGVVEGSAETAAEAPARGWSWRRRSAPTPAPVADSSHAFAERIEFGSRAQAEAQAHPPAGGAPSTDAEDAEQGRGRLGVRWRLRHSEDEPPLWHLPRLWMYRSALPRTKLLSITPQTRVSGEVEVGGQVIRLDDWPGMVGHNWGVQHAERWIWLHCAGFDDRPEDWLDISLGRVRLGRWTTPWVANGVLSVDGHRLRLGGPQRVESTVVDESRLSCHVELPGDDLSVSIDVGAPPERFVGWQYRDPDGGLPHDTTNCSIADLAVTVHRRGGDTTRLVATGTATYELGGRDQPAEIAIQPYQAL
jgi:hypothetical protein